jgi:hypothetical protein
VLLRVHPRAVDLESRRGIIDTTCLTARPEIAFAARRIDYSVPKCTENLLSTKKKSDPGSTGIVLTFYTTRLDLSGR